MRTREAKIIGTLACIVSGIACTADKTTGPGSTSEPPPPPPPATISVSPSFATINTNESTQLTASFNNAVGAVIWSSSDPSVATVQGGGTQQSSGIVSGVSQGTAFIVATVVGHQGDSVSTTATVTVTQPSISITFENALFNRAVISINGAVAGSVAPQSSAQVEIPPANTVAVSWELERSTTNQGSPVGDFIGGTFNPVVNPGSQLHFRIDAIVGTSRIFRPIFTNNSSVSLLIGVNEGLQSQNRCFCVVPAFTANIQVGYYWLYSNTTVRGYRSGSSYTGNYIYWDNFIHLVDPATGAVNLVANFGPNDVIPMRGSASMLGFNELQPFSFGAVSNSEPPNTQQFMLQTSLGARTVGADAWCDK